ncbi:MAG: glycoside hydrolase family 3 protein, partial [Brotaphodocola sp.]
MKLYKNDDGPTIGVTVKGVVQDADGRYYKDSNGNGKLDYYENWNNDPEDRAADLAEQMSVEQLAGMMMICTQFTGQVDEYAASMIASMLPQPDIKLPGKIGELVSKIIASIIRPHSKIDESGYLVERLDPILSLIMKETMGLEADGNTIKNIEDLHLRHFLLRENPTPEYMASWINQLNMVAEGTEFAIPVVVASNSRNENADSGLGTNEASGVFSTWPGTLGLAAAVRGDGGNISLIDEFASIARSEWDACGLKKGYMYMADTMTDPRWQRTYGTFGEDPELNADIIYHLVTGFQGDGGLEEDGVALTVKHFPGGGARENGFDPHYKLGKWNVYATEGSLETYHLPAFQAAIDAGVSSIMPYYAIPSAEKSASQTYEGENVPMRPVGFAFNEWFLAELLREQMGFEGYVNSDSGVTRNRDHGVEDLDDPEKTALAINAGTDIIGDIGIVQDIIDAYDRSQNNYYDTHDAPSGFTEDELILTRERMVEANTRLLTEMFELGLFENPYRNAEEAEEIVSNPDNWDAAYEAHQKSVVLLKNTEQVLPLTDEKLDGKKVYVQYFGKSDSDATTENLRDSLEGCGFKMTDDYEDADYALLFVNPSSGSTFTATDGLLELDICTDKTVHKVDQETGLLTDETFEESTIENAGQIKQIADTVHKNGGKVISNVNFTLAWLLGNVEPYSDALLAGFDTFTDATMDAILGEYTPTGRMPITLPKDDSVIAVDEEGHCISPNDIPGFAKDEYMPDNMKDENGKAYAYRDSDGNYYELNFGLMNYGENTGEPDEPDKPGDSDKP